tara:strand:- start:77 stop:1240 length:1164 start_codon:yes stop_codon:yes gene_type:complete
MKIKYPLAKETINDQDIDALCDWLKTYPRLTKADLTLEVESEWAKFIGTKYSLFNNSGSSANLLMVYAAMAAGRINNKKIAVPATGWCTTISPAMQLGLTPIMVGTDKDTYGMDLDKLEKVCKTTKPDAVIFVQVLGVPHYKERLLELKEKYGFTLLEDGCAALGAKYNDGSKVGTIGDMSSFSFYFGHQLSTIEGGMVNTSDKELYDMLLMLRSHGWGKDLDEEKYNKLIKENKIDDFHKAFTFFVPGFNLRATDLQAFIGLRQIKKANWICQRRNENHLRYAENLKDCVSFQKWDNNYPVSISFSALSKSKDHRKRIINNLVNNGIETRIFSAGNLGRHPFWTNKYGIFVDEMSDRIYQTGFFVPNYPELKPEEVDLISEVIKNS